MSQIRLTNGQRLQICKHKDENPDLYQTALPELTDNDILKEVLEAGEEEENSEDAAPVAEIFTRTEKINLLRDSCSLLDVSQESHQAAYKILRNLQLDLCTTQTTLDMRFK